MIILKSILQFLRNATPYTIAGNYFSDSRWNKIVPTFAAKKAATGLLP